MPVTPKVLIVEDNQEQVMRVCNLPLLKDRIEFLVALTIEDAERIFAENQDLAAIVMNACVPGDAPNTMDLVRKFRQTFSGPIIANSGMPLYLETLVIAGCSHAWDKYDDEWAEKLLDTLGIGG